MFLHSSPVPAHLADDFQYCRDFVRKCQDDLPVGPVLAPRRLRPHLDAIFAFARTADEFTELPGRDDTTRLRLLDDWSRRLLQAESGKPSHPIFRALAHTLEATGLPPIYLHEMLIAYRMDITNKRYDTISDLEEYCRYSANPVGRIILHLAGEATLTAGRPVPEKVRHSDAICTALQLINHWQNLGRDPWSGRPLYLPKEEMDRFEVTEEMIIKRRFTPMLGELMLYLVGETRVVLESGAPLLERVRWPLNLKLATLLERGNAVLAQIEANGGNTLRSRPQLSTWTRASCIWRALSRTSSG